MGTTIEKAADKRGDADLPEAQCPGCGTWVVLDSLDPDGWCAACGSDLWMPVGRRCPRGQR